MTTSKTGSSGKINRQIMGRIIGAPPGTAPANPAIYQLHQVDDIPFVPAFDLLENNGAGPLSDEEAAAVAVALWTATEPEPKQSSRWASFARLSAISQRL